MSKYRDRLVDLESCGLFAIGELQGLVRVAEENPPVEEGPGYLPSPAASLGWSLSIDPFPLSTIAFRVPFLPAKEYTNWMAAVFSEFRPLFDRLGITSSLEIYAHGHIPRDYRNIIPLFSLWNRDSHTFIGKYHEFTVTLLDVYLLTRLPLSGEAPLMIKESDLSEEEARVVGWLYYGANQVRNRGPFSPGTWVSFFRENYLEDPNVHVAAFLSVWLDQHVFPSSCKARSDGISSRVFQIAARLACGTRLALAPAFLGTLYWRLDQFSIDLRRSFGRFEVISMVDVCLLQAFAWEYFPAIAPSFRGDASVVLRDVSLRDPNRLRPRIFWWSRGGLPPRMSPIERGLNAFDNFFPVPFQVARNNFFFEPVYVRIRRSFLFHPIIGNEPLSFWAPQVVLSLLSGHLPAFKERLDQSFYWDREVYNPQRVLPQFGLVQGIPSTAPALSFEEIDYRFLTSNVRRQPYDLDSLRVCTSPKLTVTPAYVSYWARLQRSFRAFRTAPRPRLMAAVVSRGDPTLEGRVALKPLRFLFLLIFYVTHSRLLCRCRKCSPSSALGCRGSCRRKWRCA